MVKSSYKKHIFLDKHIGQIKNPDIIYEYKSKTCGDNLRITIKLSKDKSKIEDIKYFIFGCPGIMAGSAATAYLLKGKTIEEVKNISNEDVLSMLDGYPEEKIGCILKMLEIVKDEVLDMWSKL